MGREGRGWERGRVASWLLGDGRPCSHTDIITSYVSLEQQYQVVKQVCLVKITQFQFSYSCHF